MHTSKHAKQGCKGMVWYVLGQNHVYTSHSFPYTRTQQLWGTGTVFSNHEHSSIFIPRCTNSGTQVNMEDNHTWSITWSLQKHFFWKKGLYICCSPNLTLDLNPTKWWVLTKDGCVATQEPSTVARGGITSYQEQPWSTFQCYLVSENVVLLETATSHFSGSIFFFFIIIIFRTVTAFTLKHPSPHHSLPEM